MFLCDFAFLLRRENGAVSVLYISAEVFLVSVGFRRAVSFRECVHLFEISCCERLLFPVFIPSFIPYTFIVRNRADTRSETHSRYVLDRVRGCKPGGSSTVCALMRAFGLEMNIGPVGSDSTSEC